MKNLLRLKNEEGNQEFHVGRNAKTGRMVVGLSELREDYDFPEIIQLQLTAEQEKELLTHLFRHQGPVVV